MNKRVMNVKRSSVALASVAVLSAGCSGLLGLDDKTFDDSTATSGPSSTASSGVGGSGGASSGSGANSSGSGGLATGSGGSTTGSGGAGGVADDLAGLSDEFDYTASGETAIQAKGWNFAHVVEDYSPPMGGAEIFGVGAGVLDPGKLAVKLTETFFWFDNARGFLMYKEIDGDFLVETVVFTKSAAKPTDDVADTNTAAGLMARKPPPGNEAWVAVDRGNQGFSGVAMGSSVTLTNDGVSASTPTSGAPNGGLAICRVGSKILFLRKDDGISQWSTLATLQGADAAPYLGTMQVGALVYEYHLTPQEGILASFDHVRFSRPKSEADCFLAD